MTAELPLSIEERLARLEKIFNKLNAPPMDLLLQEGYLQIGTNNNNGAVRLDGKSLQLNAGASSGVGGVWFMPALSVDPNAEDTPKGYILGRASTDGQTRIVATVVDNDPPTAPVVTSSLYIETDGQDLATAGMEVFVDNTDAAGDEWSRAELTRDQGNDAGRLLLYQALLGLHPGDGAGYSMGDPGNAQEGDIWYNTTDNKFKGVDASATKAFLMEGDVVGMPTPITMGPGATLAIGTELASRASTGPTSGAFPAANRAILYPFYLTEDITVTQLWTYNGATASGNIDVGIYNSAFALQISSGSTAQSGTNALQVFDVTDTPLTAGQYYMAVAMDNTTGTLFRQAQQADFMRSVGCFQMASAFALPSTITPASVASAYVPHVGWTRKTTI